MIRRPYSYAIYLVVLIFCFSSLAWAEVEKTVAKTLQLESKPIDMALSADGKFTFVLTEGGKILIYDLSGQVKDTITVSETVVRIGSSPDGSFLLLADSTKNTIDVVKLDYVVDIDISNLPFKGPENAPVVVAVFRDYQ